MEDQSRELEKILLELVEYVQDHPEDKDDKGAFKNLILPYYRDKIGMLFDPDCMDEADFNHQLYNGKI